MRLARPGVYLERVDAASEGALVLRTDVAAFVGIAPRGPLDTPVPVESERQFLSHFGGFTGPGYLAYAVRGFFQNGGRRCWVVRVAERGEAAGAAPAELVLTDTAGRALFRVAASSPGVWGNALTVEWAPDSGVATTTIPSGTAPLYATVRSGAGFERGALVRIERAGAPPLFRLVSFVEGSRLYWVHPEPGCGYPTDLALGGIDLSVPWRVTRVSYALTVRENGRARAHYRRLALVPTEARYLPRVLSAPAYDGRAGVPRPAEPVVVTALGESDTARIPGDLKVLPGLRGLAGGREGLARLAAGDFVGESASPGDSDFVRTRKRRGLAALAEIDEIGLVAVPDILVRAERGPEHLPAVVPAPNPCQSCPLPPPRVVIHQPVSDQELPPVFEVATIAQVQAALVESCEAEGFRFALLSLPFTTATAPERSREDVAAFRRLFETRQAALYAPWISVVDPHDGRSSRLVPPCGHVAGAIARTDLTWGVHRAPANLVVNGTTDVIRRSDDVEHGELNDAGVNLLRSEFGRPVVLLGARTLSHDPDYRYLSVVRLILTLKRAIELSLRWTVFEPGSSVTRDTVSAAIGNLLRTFWERGALQGETPERAYFVRCDEVTTPAEARSRGQLVALVGFAPAIPCEFVVLRVGREHDGLFVGLLGDGGARAA